MEVKSVLVLQCTAALGVDTHDFPVPALTFDTVVTLQHQIFSRGKWDVRPSTLQLYVAKQGGERDGAWLTTEHPDYVLLKCGDEETLARYLNPSTFIDPRYGLSRYFSAPEPGDCVHIIVKLASEEPPLKRQKTKENFWDDDDLKPIEKVDPAECDLDNLDKAVRTMVSTPGLHAFWKDLGGFPESFLVRKEDHEVWSVVKQTLLERSDKVVLMGSPRVGKSTLVALATFYVAFVLQKKVLVIRKMKASCLEGFVVYLTPYGLVYRAANVTNLRGFVVGKPHGTRVFVDGFTQDEVKKLGLRAHTLMATPCPYDKKPDDHARLILLPAWKLENLVRYAKATDWVTKVGLLEKNPLDEEEETWQKLVEQHFFYSGGSLGEFCRTVDEIKGEVRRACALLQQDEAFRLACYPFMEYGANQPDHLRRHYVAGERTAQCYVDFAKWRALVDSDYALRLLCPRVDLPSHVELYTTAKAIGGGLERIAFEQLVHRVMCLHVAKPWKWDLRQPAAPPFHPETCVTEARCAGETEAA